LALTFSVLPKITPSLPKSHSVNGGGGEKHLKITQTVPEQHTGKARQQGTTALHCTHTV